MRWLSEHQFQGIQLGELVRFLRQGKSLPARCVTITFDDGFENIHKIAFPILQKVGFPATVFVVPNYCGKENDWPGQPAGLPRMALSGWEGILELDQGGIEIGSHTLTHPRLDHLSPQDAEYEILGSKRVIEEHLSHSVGMFAFPYGRYNDSILSVVKRAYSGAVTTRMELVRPESDPFQIGRVDTFFLRSPFLFRLLSSYPSAKAYLWIRKVLHSVKSRFFKLTWA